MFLSKSYLQLQNLVSKGCANRLFLHRFFSADTATSDTNATAASNNQITTETPGVEDKLYKKIEVEVRGNDRAVLNSYGEFSMMAAQNLGITVGRNTTPLKAIHERLTVLKSVHIYKKHRKQYETRTYYRFMDFLRLTGSTADTFLEYLQRNLPEGVAMKVTKVEIQRLPTAVSKPCI